MACSGASRAPSWARRIAAWWSTTGGSTLAAIEALHDAGQRICGVLCVLDRLAGAGEQIARAAGAPFRALATIDDIYPQRPDRQAV